MFVCSEHPVAERCGNTVAFCFDSALGSLFTFMIMFVCVPVSRTKGCLCVALCVHSSTRIRKKCFSACPVQFVHTFRCVWVTSAHLKRVKSCLSQSDSASCRLCLCSGCVRHREIKKRARGRHTHFPVRRAGIRWDGEIFSLSAVSQCVRPLVAACHKGFPAQHLSLSKCEWQWRPVSIQSSKIWQAWRDGIVHRVFRYLEKARACLLSPNNRKHVSLLALSTSSIRSCVFLSLPVPHSTCILILSLQSLSPFGFECHLQVGLSVLSYFVYAWVWAYVQCCVHMHVCLCECTCVIICLPMCLLFLCVLVFAWAPVCLTVQRVWLFLFQTTLLPLSPSLCLLLSR